MIDTIDHGPVRELRLNRPPANAISPDLILALGKAVQTAPQQGAKAIVLSGMPGMYSAGLDVPTLLTLDRVTMAEVWRDFYSLLKTMACSPIPIAAAITGHAPAGGTVLALFCDARFAAEGNFKIGLNEVAVGLMLPPIIYLALENVVGARQAERLAVGGLLVSPTEAVRVGLVDEIVPADRVIPHAIEWCGGLLKLPPQAMAATRARAKEHLRGAFAADLSSELEEVCDHWWRDETQNTLRALVEGLKKKKQ
jgi:enoyl-CoA hydratase/carnithine racemase